MIAEIRHKIYGFLFLDPPRATLSSHQIGADAGTLDDEDRSSDGLSNFGYYDDEYSYGNMFDLDPFGLDLAMGYRYSGRNNLYDDTFGDSDDPTDIGYRNSFLGKPVPTQDDNEKEVGIKRHLSILRTNRQIYTEASTFLHSDLTIVMEPGDALTDTPGNPTVKRSKNVWRHAPSNKLPVTSTSGQTVYTTNSLDGALEPHVFARFERISLVGDLDFNLDEDAPTFYINDDLSASAEDEAEFLSYLTATKDTTEWCKNPFPPDRFDHGRHSKFQAVAFSHVNVIQSSIADVIRRVVDLLSCSPIIRHLEFVLSVKVMCSNPDESIDSSDEEDSDTEAEGLEKDVAADERATELFLESGILDPLRSLSNVMRFSLKIEMLGGDYKSMKLKKKHLEIIGDLKKAIETNWVVKHGAH